MDDILTLTDQILDFGEQIGAAVEASAWTRLSALVERRAQVAQRLAEATEAAGGPPLRTTHPEKFEALTDQHERLNGLLRRRSEQTEGELAQIDQLKSARDSYGAAPPRRSILNAELAG